VFEQVGHDEVYHNIHTRDSGKAVEGFTTYLPTNDEAFHSYGMLWTKETITWYIDGKAVGSVATPTDMNQPMYMLLNLAIGGKWPGDPDGRMTSAEMKVDYVRVYQIDDTIAGLAVGKTLLGSDGSDALTGTSAADVLEGGGGIDIMSGGGGDDVYKVDQWSDRVIEKAGDGTDTVEATSSFVLPENVENLLYVNDGHAELHGNEAADRITSRSNWSGVMIDGEGGNDMIVAGGASDRIIGGSGDDTLTGGGGDDTFVFDWNSGTDVITDFEMNHDVLDFSAFAGWHPTMAQVNNDVVVSVYTSLVTLLGVHLSDLTVAHTGDFILA
jgi:serralysin